MSAGTMSPRRSSTTSPGTRSVTSTSTGLAVAQHDGLRGGSASAAPRAAFSARYSLTNPSPTDAATITPMISASVPLADEVRRRRRRPAARPAAANGAGATAPAAGGPGARRPRSGRTGPTVHVPASWSGPASSTSEASQDLVGGQCARCGHVQRRGEQDGPRRARGGRHRADSTIGTMTTSPIRRWPPAGGRTAAAELRVVVGGGRPSGAAARAIIMPASRGRCSPGRAKRPCPVGDKEPRPPPSPRSPP